MDREPDTQTAFTSLNNMLRAINVAFDDLIRLKRHKLYEKDITPEQRAIMIDHMHEGKYRALTSIKNRYDRCGGGLE